MTARIRLYGLQRSCAYLPLAYTLREANGSTSARRSALGFTTRKGLSQGSEQQGQAIASRVGGMRKAPLPNEMPGALLPSRSNPDTEE